jgi:hypothetical protein
VSRGSSRLAAALLLACTLAPLLAHAFTIDARFDASITNDPQASTIEGTINSAIAQYQAKILDGSTSQIRFFEQTTGLGNSRDYGPTVPYTTYLAALQSHGSSIDDAVVLSHLPGGPNNPVNNNAGIRLTQTLARTLGLASAPEDAPRFAVSRRVSVLSSTGDRGAPAERSTIEDAGPATIEAATEDTIYLNTGSCNLSPSQTDPTKYSLFAVACHEMDEVIGFGSAMTSTPNGNPAPTGAVQPEDLFRFDPRGARSWTTTLADTAYCSFDGFTVLARFNQKSTGDASDWFSPGGPAPMVQDAFQTQGSAPQMGVEWRVLDAIGYSFSPAAIWVDFTYGGGGSNGLYATPYNTLAAGLAAAPSGGAVFIKAGGSTSEQPTINQSVLLTTVGGSATIGQ